MSLLLVLFQTKSADNDVREVSGVAQISQSHFDKDLRRFAVWRPSLYGGCVDILCEEVAERLLQKVTQKLPPNIASEQCSVAMLSIEKMIFRRKTSSDLFKSILQFVQN